MNTLERKPAHWSERPTARQPLQRHPAGSGRHPSSSRRPPRAGRRPSPRSEFCKGFFIVVIVFVVALAAAATVLFWYLPKSSDTEAEEAALATAQPALTTESSSAVTSSTSPARTDSPERFVLYESASLECSFQYPDRWVEFTPQAALGVSVDDPSVFIVGDPATEDPAGAPNDFVHFLGKRWPGQTAPTARSAVEEMMTSFPSNYPPTATLLEPATDFQLGGMSACSWAVRDQRQWGAQVTRTVFISYEDGLYMFDFWSTEASLPENQTIFDRMLRSFRPPPSDR